MKFKERFILTVKEAEGKELKRTIADPIQIERDVLKPCLTENAS